MVARALGEHGGFLSHKKEFLAKLFKMNKPHEVRLPTLISCGFIVSRI